MTPQQSVLVVDDEPDIIALLRTALTDQGFAVESAASAMEARSRMSNRTFDVMLLDVALPGEDGLTLLHKLRQSGSRMKVVLMSGGGTPANLIGALREHATQYLSKPFSPKAAVDTVRMALAADISSLDEFEVVSARPEWISVMVRCRLETADRLAQFFRELSTGLTHDQQENLVTAFRELLVNAIEHGCRLDPAKRVFLSYIRTSRAVIYYIHDPGEGFSIENLPHAAVSNKSESPMEHALFRDKQGMRPGGFGILLSQQLVDDVIYNEKGNEVMLIKYQTPGDRISS